MWDLQATAQYAQDLKQYLELVDINHVEAYHILCAHMHDYTEYTYKGVYMTVGFIYI